MSDYRSGALIEEIHVRLGQILDDVIAGRSHQRTMRRLGSPPAMLAEMAGELRHALEQVSGASAKGKTELKKKRKR
ncbi:hypothetical protein NXY40_21565 [Phocaeicola vulgatus]|nr:hypothetical protein [Phocaeicola vulgatus]